MGWSGKYIQLLNEAFKGDLPGEESHLKMLPPGRSLNPTPDQILKAKQSSVLIILYPEKLELWCVLIKRVSTMKYHAGQIAFPGGIINPTDTNPLDAALREANEEVGLDPETITVIGKLSQLYISVSGFIINPFVGYCKIKPTLTQNFNEVNEIIYYPLTVQIKNNEICFKKIETPSGTSGVPCYVYKNEIIWGATAMILSELIDLLKNRITT